MPRRPPWFHPTQARVPRRAAPPQTPQVPEVPACLHASPTSRPCRPTPCPVARTALWSVGCRAHFSTPMNAGRPAPPPTQPRPTFSTMARPSTAADASTECSAAVGRMHAPKKPWPLAAALKTRAARSSALRSGRAPPKTSSASGPRAPPSSAPRLNASSRPMGWPAAASRMADSPRSASAPDARPRRKTCAVHHRDAALSSAPVR